MTDIREDAALVLAETMVGLAKVDEARIAEAISREDSILLLAESVVELARTQREASASMVREVRELVEMVRTMEVRVEAPQVRFDVPAQPTPVVNVTVPERQRVDIVSLPRMDAKVKRDRDGRITGIEEV